MLAAGVLAFSACSNSHTSLAYASGVKVDCGGKQTLTVSGSTAQANAMTRFIDGYKKACPGQTLDYHANGSGAGVSEFLAGKTDFGGSDIPLSGDQYAAAKQRCGGADAWNLPVVFGPMAITYNLEHRRLVGARRTHDGKDLQRHHHPLGRPGPHRAQRLHAGRGHQGHLP